MARTTHPLGARLIPAEVSQGAEAGTPRSTVLKYGAVPGAMLGRLQAMPPSEPNGEGSSVPKSTVEAGTVEGRSTVLTYGDGVPGAMLGRLIPAPGGDEAQRGASSGASPGATSNPPRRGGLRSSAGKDDAGKAHGDISDNSSGLGRLVAAVEARAATSSASTGAAVTAAPGTAAAPSAVGTASMVAPSAAGTPAVAGGSVPTATETEDAAAAAAAVAAVAAVAAAAASTAAPSAAADATSDAFQGNDDEAQRKRKAWVSVADGSGAAAQDAGGREDDEAIRARGMGAGARRGTGADKASSHHARCQVAGCTNTASHTAAVDGGPSKATHCGRHKAPGMRDVVHRRCRFEGCTTNPSYGTPGSKKPRRCIKHREEGMVNVTQPACGYVGCETVAAYNLPGEKRPAYCSQHKLVHMVRTKPRRQCRQPGCPTQPCYGLFGSGMGPVVCANHKEKDMINLTSSRCRAGDCKRWPSFGPPISRTPLYCLEHKPDNEEMINIVKRKCPEAGCARRPSYGPVNGAAPTLCSQHRQPGMVKY